MIKREKQKEVFRALVNKQLEPHGVTYEHVLKDPDWYMNYQTTPEKEQEFIAWGTELIRNELKLNKKMAEMEMSWFILQWGLTTSEYFEKNPEANQNTVKVEKRKTSK